MKLCSSMLGMTNMAPFLYQRHNTIVPKWSGGVTITCVTSRAVHLDIVDSINIDSCTNAIERFIRKYGDVTHAPYSDYETKFCGVDNSIRDMYNRINHLKYQRYYKPKRISWIFNTPLTSPQGRAWECLIRSICCLLSALLDDPNNKTRPCNAHHKTNKIIQRRSDSSNRPCLLDLSTHWRALFMCMLTKRVLFGV